MQEKMFQVLQFKSSEIQAHLLWDFTNGKIKITD